MIVNSLQLQTILLYSNFAAVHIITNHKNKKCFHILFNVEFNQNILIKI